MIAIGLGFRKACTAQTLVGLVRQALAQVAADHPGVARSAAVLATIAEKDRPVLHEAAAVLGLAVTILPKHALGHADDRLTVRSERAKTCFGIPSVAEAAALTAAGPGACLIVPRIGTADATCAVAASATGPETP